MRVWVPALLLLSACTVTVSEGTPTPSPPTVNVSPSPTQAPPSPQPSASPTRSSVLAIVGGPKGTSVSLVASDGSVVATALVDPAPFLPNAVMSWTSASRTRLYYLNAGSEVRYLAPDGTSGTATRIALGANEQAGFSVSPDDTKVAVAIFSYASPPAQGPTIGAYAGMRLYVEDLQGGGHHVDIFSSPTLAEFPIGWTAGRLVLAVGEPTCCQALTLNPYAATSYHVADPGTGNQLASLCDNSTGPGGPVEPIGVVCFENGPPVYQRWDGTFFNPPTAVTTPIPYLVALALDGGRFAAGGDPMHVEGPRGADVRLGDRGYVFGWLDADRFVYQRDIGSPLRVFHVPTGSAVDISPGFSAYLGTFPAAIS
jgi:hypothetical protein